MEPGFPITEFDDCTENIDHKSVVALLLNYLLLYETFQLLLFRVKDDGIFYTLKDDIRVKGAADIIHNTVFVTLFNIFPGIFR